MSGISVDVVRKDIKNLHVGVYPPSGRVRVAAPLSLGNEAVRLAIVSRLGWIARARKAFVEQIRQSEREFVTGESHYLWGRRFLLDVIEGRMAGLAIRGGRRLQLVVPPGTNRAKRGAVLYNWYREELRKEIPSLVAKWRLRTGIDDVAINIRRMKTRWGTCHAHVGRIWLNLELVKKPRSCLEYILVHEMVHLLERSHGDRFRAHMERLMPDWKLRRAMLNSSPLAHEDWKY